MAIPHIGHGRVIKYGGNDAANSRDISMMPGDFKKMGDQNKDMSPVKFISGAGSKQGAAKMMQQSYGAPAPGPAKNKPCPPGENCDEEGFRYITQSRLDSNALDSNASGATSANALGGTLNEVVITGNKNNTSPSTEKKGKTAVGGILQSVGNTISSLFKPKFGFKATKFGKNKNKRQRTGV
tara:strand:- start:20 stop:565 length:546 start_codon:yes stop_codon:yes gene_type:complete